MMCKAEPDSVCFDSENKGPIDDTPSISTNDASCNLAGDIYNIVDTSSSNNNNNLHLPLLR